MTGEERKKRCQLTKDVEADRVFQHCAGDETVFDAARQVFAIVVGARCQRQDAGGNVAVAGSLQTEKKKNVVEPHRKSDPHRPLIRRMED